jgi:sortase A
MATLTERASPGHLSGVNMSTRMEKFFGIAGASGVVYLCVVYLQAQAYTTRAAHLVSPAAHTAPDRSILGRIEIPTLNLSAAILPNDDPDSLRKGIGHIPKTALPGGLGTVGLAGHRDTFFRPLRTMSPHAEIDLVVPSGTYRYQVDSTEIVTPDRVDILATGIRPELILITCFPFDYIGAAPKRFIVHAHLLSVSPDSATQTISRLPHEVSLNQNH